MTIGNPDQVGVYVDAPELGPCRRVGTLRPAAKSQDSPISFAYEADWVADPRSFVIDPGHYLDPGPQFFAGGQIAPVFTDSSPDRWGRMLLDYREYERARSEGRKTRSLGEWDYLLGVHDDLRMGALRYAASDVGPFLDDDPAAIPPATELRELEHAARVVEEPGRRGEDAVREALRRLLAPGSPMGGARPKTTFRDAAGNLWMAKFPSHNDRRDTGAWEYVLNRLARRAGIDVPEVDLRVFVGPNHTFLARRFDRIGEGRRMFASAMTLLGRRDREDSSYVDIAEAIAAHGAPDWIEADLEQLFRRLVFNILAGHRDDHLRNHGFLRTGDGWRLAPAYDLNPMPDKTQHELAIGIVDRASDVEIAVEETAPFCRLSPRQAQAVVAEVRASVERWRDVAAEAGVSRIEIEQVSPAFAVDASVQS
jgi:serine/threonine-protein kinase HipA